ncbi:MAG: NAD(P)H-dependent oxidoreductase subunit E [Oscillospiraceae bacterium]|nr:NAD(P)H-dependent oxidoreductase subunit E [Oscillospiraceae bacterium]
MEERFRDYRTPASLLVEVAKLTAPYRGQRDRLSLVTTKVREIVPVLSYDVVSVIAREMDIDVSTIYGFITFYAMLSTKPHGKFTVRMCKSTPCHVNGAAEVVRAVEEQLGIHVGETTEDGRFTLEYCPCLGMCDIAPAIMINRKVYGNLTPESVRDILKSYIRGDVEA